MGHSTDIELIILATTKVGDSSAVIHTLSREYGRRSFIVGIGKNTRMSLFLPLNTLQCKVMENPRTDLWRASAFTSVFPLNGLRSDIRKNTITLFLSEVLYRSLHDGVYEDHLYEWCKEMILTLDSLTDDYASFHLRFLFEYAAVLGFSPDIESLAPFAGEHYEDIRNLLEADLTGFLLYPLNGTSRSEIAEALLEYLGVHLDYHLNIQSLDVLRELFR